MKIVKVPAVNGLGKTGGSEKGADAVLEKMREVYSSSRLKPVNVDNLDVSKIELKGDLIEDNDLIYDFVFNLEGGERRFFLGGDHSVSYPLVRAFFDRSDYAGEQSRLIVFDAHPDCMEPVDSKIPTHEEWLRALIDDGFLGENILLVGARNGEVSEISYLKEKGVKMISAEELMFDLEAKVDAIMEFGSGKNVYVSVDIDCVDCAFAPGTGYCEPGGISSREILYIMRRLRMVKGLCFVDLVEINPDKDIAGMSASLGAKILSEFVC